MQEQDMKNQEQMLQMPKIIQKDRIRNWKFVKKINFSK